MFCLLLDLAGFTQLRMPGIFGHHMVVQRNQAVPVWGWSLPGDRVTVLFNGQSKKTTADKQGSWRIVLDPQAEGGPFDMIVQGKGNILFHDVYVGEVWVCSGQSNMEFALSDVHDAGAEIHSAVFPEIRQIKIPHDIGIEPKNDILPAKWEICSPETAGNFTAVGYFFAREIAKRLHVAVGLVNSSWGGTMSETWTSRGAFENSPEFKSTIEAIPEKDFQHTLEVRRQRLEQQIRLLQKNITDSIPENDWKNPDYNSQVWPKISVAVTWESQPLGLTDLDGIVWFRKEVVLDSVAAQGPITISLGTIDDNDITYVNATRVGSTKSWNQNRVYVVPTGVFRPGKNLISVRVEDTGGGGGFYGDSTAVHLITSKGNIPLGGPWNFRVAKIFNYGGIDPNDFPCLLYNAMIHPLIPFAIRGVLWYQGEANADRAYQYRMAFPLMITDWRQHWGEGDFPFYFVQLASFNAANGNSAKGSTWAELREAQAYTLTLPATGMAVTTDIGESMDIHPKNKKDVGLRLAALALNNLYGQTMEYSGPMYQSMKIQGNKINLSFTHTGTGLMIRDKYGYIRGFEIAGSDRHFQYAKAFIQDNWVTVYADQVTQPVAVRYNWADDAGEGNLYNQEGFPAAPFRTDLWKGITEDKKFMMVNER
jgi:sialate O-acetylesterase